MADVIDLNDRRSKRRSDVLEWVGGPPDEFGACVAIYGEELDPEEISAALGKAATRTFRKGERARPRSEPARRGAWLREVRGKAPKTPAELIRDLLAELTGDTAVWAGLADRFDTQLRLAVHTDRWNMDFEVERDLVQKLSLRCLSLVVDLYTYHEPDSEER